MSVQGSSKPDLRSTVRETAASGDVASVNPQLLDLRFDKPQNGRAKYERLRDHFIEQLKAGGLKPGDAMPTEWVIAKAVNVARSTVRQAMALLEQEGLVVRVRGKGTFVHDDALRRLRRGQQTGLFALITPDVHSVFYPDLLGSFHDAAGAIRHQVVVSNTENDIYRQADIILQLMDRRVAGVAIVPTTSPPTPPHQILQLQKHGIPVVFCHRSVDGVAGPLLAIPFREAGRMAGEALARRGHRRVAMFTPHQTPVATDVRKAGLREGLRTGGGDLDERFSYCGESTSTDISRQEQAVRSLLEKLLHDPNRPTAICATFDNLAELIYLHLCKLGIRVPEEMSLVGFGGARRDGAINSRLTSVVMDEAEVGRRAVALLQRMQQGEIPLHHDEETFMPLTWAEGRTLGPAP